MKMTRIQNWFAEADDITEMVGIGDVASLTTLTLSWEVECMCVMFRKRISLK